jgi:hypothetical protein
MEELVFEENSYSNSNRGVDPLKLREQRHTQIATSNLQGITQETMFSILHGKS